MIRKFCTCFIVLFMTPIVHSQPIKSWQKEINQNDKFYEVTKKIDQYFDHQSEKAPEYKHYMRWKGEMSYHVDPQGNTVNINAYRARATKKTNSRLHVNQSNNRSYSGSWDLVGPTDYFGGDVFSGGGIGRVNCMAFHPTDINTFYVGSANGGMWKTTDYGTTWMPMTDHLPTIGISGIVVNQNNPNIIHLLTGDGDGAIGVPNFRKDSSIGILKSTDGGSSWSTPNVPFADSSFKYGYDLVAKPDNQNVILAAMGTEGIFRTFDGGTTWSRVDSNRTVWDLEFSTALPELVYAATSDGLLRSINGGSAFQKLDVPSFPTNYLRMSIALSPSDSSTVYALFGGGAPAGMFTGVFKSEDFGATFTMQSNSPNILGNSTNGSSAGNFADYTLAFIVDPTDDDQIFAAGVNMWKSQDAGVTWGRETWSTKNFEIFDPYVHADWHKMYFQGTTLFAATDGGVAISTDYGNDWSELTSGLAITQIYEINILGDNYLISCQDNGIMEGTDGDLTGKNVLGGDGFGCVNHPSQDLEFITSQDRLARRAIDNNVFIWEEGGGFWYTDIKFHTDDLDFIFFDKGNELFRGNQASISIADYHFDSLKTNAILTNGILGFSQANAPSTNIMFVADQTHVIRTLNLDDEDPTWTQLTNPAADSANISDVLISPTDPTKVWMSCSGYHKDYKIFYSFDQGDNWTNISGGLPNVPIRCIAYDTGSNGGIYAGTDIGIFYKNNNMLEWVYFSHGLPNTVVTDIEVSNGSVYAGTYGRGLWKSSTFSACPVSLLLTDSNDPGTDLTSGQQLYNASNEIISLRKVVGGFETSVTYQATDHIDLSPGFEAAVGVFFEAKPGPCPN